MGSRTATLDPSGLRSAESCLGLKAGLARPTFALALSRVGPALATPSLVVCHSGARYARRAWHRLAPARSESKGGGKDECREKGEEEGEEAEAEGEEAAGEEAEGGEEEGGEEEEEGGEAAAACGSGRCSRGAEEGGGDGVG